jgi:D-inositol-3-phosphate glycosyltransferase
LDHHLAIIGPVYPFRGGIAHFNSHLALHLQDQGNRVSVFSFRRQYPSWLYPGESDRDPSLKPLQVPAKFLLDPFYPWTWFDTMSAIEKSQPDVIIVPWWVTFWAPAFGILIRSLQKKFPVIVLIHNVIPHENKFWDKSLTRFALAKATGYITQTEEQYRKLLELLPKASDRVRVCSHPIYDLISGKQIEQVEARKQLNLPLDRKNLLFFGIVRSYKGLHQLIDAMAILEKRGKAPTLAIAGEFWEKVEDYQHHIHQAGLGDLVRIFPGYQPDEKLPLYFSAADLLVAPYLRGTQSGVVKLALGAGLPVLLSTSITDPLLEQLVGKGVSFCNPLNPEEFADEIQNALESSSYKINSKEIASMSWQNLVQTIEKLAKLG